MAALVTATRTVSSRESVAFRRGMTLVEMLVATAVTLIMMAAIAQLFGTLGQGVNGTRSLIEIDDRMRAVAYRLRADLQGVTAPVHESPPLRPDRNMGYFELIEGPITDRSAIDNFIEGEDDNRLVGDWDDILLFTTRSPADLFSGRTGGRPIQSPLAEVVWYCRPTPGTIDPVMYTLYRRQRLVMAHPGAPPFIDPASPNAVPFTTWGELHTLTDIACRIQGGYAIPNTLGELTKRENRFCRGDMFPYRFLRDKVDVDGNFILTFTETHPRYGEDVILTNVIAFDVRVQDRARIQAVGPYLIGPGDVGYGGVGAVNAINGLPAFIDLGWNGSSSPVAIGAAFPPSGGPAASRGLWSAGVAVRNGPPPPLNLMGPATYDTWSTHYEYNSIDDDGDNIVDQGTDGIDNPPENGLIDEPEEAETSPPYPVPLTGIEVRIRCYEPSSRQVRQVTVRHTFVPH